MAVWGIADPLPLPVVYETVAGADVDVGATETDIITTPAIAALNQGPYYPLLQGVLTIVLGAMAPSALQFAFTVNAGSDVDVYVVEPGLLVALAELVIPIFLIGLNSNTAWQGAGSVISVTGTSATNDVTAKFVGSRCLIGLQRGPDL